MTSAAAQRPMLIPAAVTAWSATRIEALLLPQNWKDSKSWNDECNQLITDIRAAEADSKHDAAALLPDMTRWTGDQRPQWAAGRVGLFKGMEFVNPIFAWLSIELWLDATYENVSGLFHVLMRCGCDSDKALGAVTSTGRVVLQFAAAEAYAGVTHHLAESTGPTKNLAVNLLLAQPNLPLFSATADATDRDRVADDDNGPFCCALCTVMHNRLDDAAVEVLLRLTPAQRLAVTSGPHCAFARAGLYSCPRTFVALWSVVRDRVVQPDCDAAEVDRIFRGRPSHDDGYCPSAIATVAFRGDAHAWRLVTNARCPLAAALLRHANAHPQRECDSPLDVLWAEQQTRSERDIRGAWLVPRLCADVLNAYDEYGRTPIMCAAKYALPRTLTALLDRGVEVDLCAQAFERKTGTGYVSVNALARAATKFTAITAADLLPPDDYEELMTAQFIPIAARLRAETKAQMALRPLIAAAVVPVLQQFGGPQMPRELVGLCLTYAGLPEPAVWPTPLLSACAGAKHATASAVSSAGDRADGNADGIAKPLPPKRLRLA